MEIRNKVTNYVAKKIWASKKENPGKVRITQYLNIAVLRANTMKTMANFFGNIPKEVHTWMCLHIQ